MARRNLPVLGLVLAGLAAAGCQGGSKAPHAGGTTTTRLSQPVSSEVTPDAATPAWTVTGMHLVQLDKELRPFVSNMTAAVAGSHPSSLPSDQVAAVVAALNQFDKAAPGFPASAQLSPLVSSLDRANQGLLSALSTLGSYAPMTGPTESSLRRAMSSWQAADLAVNRIFLDNG